MLSILHNKNKRPPPAKKMRPITSTLNIFIWRKGKGERATGKTLGGSFFLQLKKRSERNYLLGFHFQLSLLAQAKKFRFVLKTSCAIVSKSPQNLGHFAEKTDIFLLFLEYSSPRLVCLRANTILKKNQKSKKKAGKKSTNPNTTKLTQKQKRHEFPDFLFT